MNFVYYNANPNKTDVGDCTIRAISTVLNKSWDEVYIGLSVLGFEHKDMPSSNNIWHKYLEENGYNRFFYTR